MRSSLLLAACLLLSARLPAAEPSALERLAACLTGTFSSADQARGDQNFRNVTLHVAPVWADRTDGPWLYAEQALADAPDHPYRQRLYQLATRADSSLECRVFDLPDPIAATGAWKDPSRLGSLKPAGLAAQDTCTLILRAQPDGSFKGGTEGKGWINTLRGASYASAEITITAKETIIWERGYNASATQVWGSIHGGYVFMRTE
ncbi:MAG: chromophore lyase CpcT/CpeT [bacterium]|nr:chromophore lyase CpcT/CpeT [bacterium]MDI1334824.1 chromophore lyase CpcT/CpeT [Lacunisphaera sp.]